MSSTRNTSHGSRQQTLPGETQQSNLTGGAQPSSPSSRNQHSVPVRESDQQESRDIADTRLKKFTPDEWRKYIEAKNRIPTTTTTLDVKPTRRKAEPFIVFKSIDQAKEWLENRLISGGGNTTMSRIRKYIRMTEQPGMTVGSINDAVKNDREAANKQKKKTDD